MTARPTYRTTYGRFCENCGWSVVDHIDGRFCPKESKVTLEPDARETMTGTRTRPMTVPEKMAAISKVLKQRFANLSVEETIQLATDILIALKEDR